MATHEIFTISKYVQGIHQNTALSRAPVSRPTKNDEIFINETEEFTDCVIRNLPATDQRLDEVCDAQIGDAICTQIKTMWMRVGLQLRQTFPFSSLTGNMQPISPWIGWWFAHVCFEVADPAKTFNSQYWKRFMQVTWVWVNVKAELNSVFGGLASLPILRLCATSVVNAYYTEQKGRSLYSPWSRLIAFGIELVQICWNIIKKDYVVVVDYASRWLDFKELSTTTSQAVIRALCDIFATHGAPNVVISDNGPQYSSQIFEAFASDWGFTHVTSSPKYPQLM